MSDRTLKQLLAAISTASDTLLADLEAKTVDSTVNSIEPLDLNAVDQHVIKSLVNACRELQVLAQGPGQMLSLMAFAYHDTSSLGTILEFNIPSLVPLDGTATISFLAKETGLLEDKLARIIRYATTNFIFHEPTPGVIAHTAASAALARDAGFATFLRLVLVDLAPLAVALPAACRQWPQSEKPEECGLNAAFGTADKFFEWLSRDNRRQERFDAGMAGFSAAAGENGDRPQSIDVKAYPWDQKLPAASHVVDVGGGSGHVARALALAYPQFKFTVQDRPEAIASSADHPDKPFNLSFQAHDFFSTQSLHGADVYFLRQIIHDWPRAESLAILRALIPALKPGARVLISEYTLTEHGTGQENMIDQKLIRQMDLQMMAVFNSKERTAEEFAELFAQADHRLQYVGSYQAAEDPKSCIFEAVWRGES